MIKVIILCLIGVFISVEGLISLWWAYNDKRWFAQLARVSRVVAGGVIICLVFLESNGLFY